MRGFGLTKQLRGEKTGKAKIPDPHAATAEEFTPGSSGVSHMLYLIRAHRLSSFSRGSHTKAHPQHTLISDNKTVWKFNSTNALPHQ